MVAYGDVKMIFPYKFDLSFCYCRCTLILGSCLLLLSGFVLTAKIFKLNLLELLKTANNKKEN